MGKKKSKKSSSKSVSASVPQELRQISLTEERLQQALAGLLTRIPGIEDVQILQGAQEYGKDIVFRFQGAVEEPVHCAAVVKRDKITGSVTGHGGARNVVFQIQQAFDTPYVDESGTKTFIERVYVMLPPPISQSALNSIQGRLRERKGQIVFLSGHRLLSLFQKYWPDFLADEVSSLDRYAKTMSENLNNRGELKQLGVVYDIVLPEDQMPRVYVDIGFERQFKKHVFSVVDIVSTRKSLRQAKWSLQGIETLKERCGTLVSVFQHLEQCEGLLSNTKVVAKLRRQCDRFLEEYPRAWQRLREKEKEEGYEGSQNALLPVGLDEKLDELRADVRITAREGLSKLVEENIRYEKTIHKCKKNKKTGVVFLKSNDFLNAMYFDACLSLMPTCESSAVWSTDFPATLLNDWPQSILIAGPAGSGKTSFCRWNALRDIDSFLEDETQPIPVYVGLYNAPIKKGKRFKAFLEDAISESTLLGDHGRNALRKRRGQKLRVYLDGLDEIPDPTYRKHVAIALKEATRKDKNIQCVITSRDYAVGPWISWLPRVSLKNLDPGELERLAFRWLGESNPKTNEFLKQLKKLSEDAGMKWTPLLATLTIMVYKQTNRLPESRTRLYEVFIDLLSGGWDVAKGVIRPSNFTRDWKIRVLGHLAYSMHRKGNREFSRADVVQSIEWIGQCKLEASNDAVSELLRDSILISEGDYVQFRHLSFQEYLAARHCVSQPRDDKIKFAAKQLGEGNKWWCDVLRFYAGIVGDWNSLKAWLNTYHLGHLSKEIGL